MALRQHDYRAMTRQELYGLAKERDIEGRSRLSKDELAEALELDDVGPDAVTLLIEQHDEIRGRFARFEDLSSRPSKKKRDLVRGIVTHLMKHARIEEQVFYPAVREELQDLEDEVDEDIEEHHLAELLLAELASMPPEAPRYDAKVTVLIESVTHHLEEEEEHLFPRVREEMEALRRRELGAAMLEAWRAVSAEPQLRVVAVDPGDDDAAEAHPPAGEPAVAAAVSSDEDSDDAMTRSEEELLVGTTKRKAGSARLRKQVVSERVTESVPVQREEPVVEREPISEADAEAGEEPSIAEAEQEVTLHREVPVVEKRTVPKERVRLEKETRTDRQLVGGDVGREAIEVEFEGGEGEEGESEGNGASAAEDPSDAADREIDLAGLEESRQEPGRR